MSRPTREIAPSLGRNLTAGPNGTVSVNLIEPNSVLSDRVNQLDLRLSRNFVWRATKIRASFDVYNALNANPVSQWNQTYGRNGAVVADADVDPARPSGEVWGSADVLRQPA